MIKYWRIWPLPNRSRQANECEQAITYYRTVVSLNKSAYGAEARYEIANCFFVNRIVKDAEKAAFEVINKSGSYENGLPKLISYWEIFI